MPYFDGSWKLESETEAASLADEEIHIKYGIKDRDSLLLVKEDIGRQLHLASDRQNAMLQSIGIIVAFASILIAQIITRNPSFDGLGALLLVSLVSLLSCSGLGIYSIVTSDAFTIFLGMDDDVEVNLLNKRETNKLEVDIVNNMKEALDDTLYNNQDLLAALQYLGVLLILGLITLLFGWGTYL